MKKFIITTTIEEEVEANDRDEAYQMFFKSVGNDPQQTLATYFSDHLKIEEQEDGFSPAEKSEVTITSQREPECRRKLD